MQWGGGVKALFVGCECPDLTFVSGVAGNVFCASFSCNEQKSTVCPLTHSPI